MWIIIYKNEAWSKSLQIYFQGKQNTCICTRSSDLIRRDGSFSLFSPRGPHKESISSRKIMEGAFLRASWIRSETCCSLSPIHLDTMSDGEILCINSTHVNVLATFHLYKMIVKQTHLHLWEICTWTVINAPENNWLEEVENKTIGNGNQLKHNGVDDEFRNSTHSNNVTIALKKLIKGAKDPTIWSKETTSTI